jgi:hypothetical protein
MTTNDMGYTAGAANADWSSEHPPQARAGRDCYLAKTSDCLRNEVVCKIRTTGQGGKMPSPRAIIFSSRLHGFIN